MTEYRIYNLTPGQQAPAGSTGHAMPNGIVWIGVDGTFPTKATTDPNMKGANSTYDSHIMSQKELDEYNLLLKYIKLPEGISDFISFEEFKDTAVFEARKQALKDTISALTNV